MQTRMQILGWIDHCEREHPGKGTVIPAWLCSMDAVSEALHEGYIEQVGQQSIVPRMGVSFIIYGLTEKGRVTFSTGLPVAGEPNARR